MHHYIKAVSQHRKYNRRNWRESRIALKLKEQRKWLSANQVARFSPQTEFTETTQFPWSEVSQQIIRSKRVYGVVRKLAIQSFYNCNLMSISIMFLNLTSDASFLTTRIKSSRLLESRLELPISHFHTTRSAEPQPSRQLGRRRLERIPRKSRRL